MEYLLPHTHRHLHAVRSPRRPRPGRFALIDFFVNSLVIAGHCRKHFPHAKRCFTGSSATPGSAKAGPAPSATEYVGVDSPGDSKVRSVPICVSVDNRWPRSGPIAASVCIPQPGSESAPFSKKAPLQSPDFRGFNQSEISIYRSLQDELPPETFLNPRAYAEGKHNYQYLFDFFFHTLGYAEGVKALMVVLSNPNSMLRTIGKPTWSPGEDHLEIPEVRRLLWCLPDTSVSNQELFRMYRSLPQPRVTYLSHETRKSLLHRFANPSRRRAIDTLRYLSVIEDMCEASLPLTPAFWTAAIVMAGKNVSKVSKHSLRAALGVWRRMEFEGKVESTSITFNILFDLAIKAGQFKVADRIVLEMHNRGIDFSRFGRVAQIFYCGLVGDSDGVREAYHNFVKAGEIVDTTVLNCVMASLIRTGYVGIAEQMYENMKSVHRLISRGDDSMLAHALPSESYASYRKANKRLGRVLGMAACLRDKLPEHHRAIQAALPLTPDAKTFHIFFSYHALVSGDLERFLNLLDDMEKLFDIPPQGMVYLFLFEGFARHGGKNNTPWDFRRLSRAWSAFLRDLNISEQQSVPQVQKRISQLVWDAPATYNQHDPDCDEEVYFDDDGTDDHDETIYPQDAFARTDYRPDAHSVDTYSRSRFEEAEDEDNEDEGPETGVFLGRRMIIACLRAHDVCGGPKAVARVWEQIKPLWRVESRRLKDIIAVNQELYRLLPNHRV